MRRRFSPELKCAERSRLDAPPEACNSEPLGDMFAKRVQPLLEDDRPKSCNQCHLAGIDLGAFVRDDACETMACLVEDGLVDLETPKDSLLLSWIGRAEPDSELITEQVIDEEYQGFLQWIEHAAACGEAECGDAECGEPEEQAVCEDDPTLSLEEVEALEEEEADCSDLGLERLFRDTIYAARGRCYPCHYDVKADGIAGDPPPWIVTQGSCAEASLATLRELQAGNLLDADEPERSLVLLKPLGEEAGGVEHGGSDKFHGEEDPGYRSFMLFLQRYSECGAGSD